jgi:hypothetical protein
VTVGPPCYPVNSDLPVPAEGVPITTNDDQTPPTFHVSGQRVASSEFAPHIDVDGVALGSLAVRGFAQPGRLSACRTTRLGLGSLHSPCQSASGSKETFLVQSLTILLSGPCLPHEKKMTNRMKIAPGGAYRTAVQARRTPQGQSLHKRRES